VFEHHTQPLATQAEFARRMLRYSLVTTAIILFSLVIGMIGYHYFESLSWIDSLLNASMILGGMGPVNALQTNAGKIFASFYALYSGIILLASVGILVTPIFHRFLHRFHLEIEDN
jgi:putative effector of murein hydrolase